MLFSRVMNSFKPVHWFQGHSDQPGKMTCILKPGVLDCNQPLLCSWVVVFSQKSCMKLFCCIPNMKTFTSPLRVWTCLENAGLWTLIWCVWVMSIFNLFPKSLRLLNFLLDWKYRGDKNWTYNFRCILIVSVKDGFGSWILLEIQILFSLHCW